MFAEIRTRLAALVVGALVAANGIQLAHAGPQDYRFEAVQPQVKSSNDTQIAVRLIHVPTGKAVTDAVIFQTRLDMSPMGMGDMTVKATPAKTQEPGLYQFQAPLSMEGDWALQLSAKVPGEADTVRGSVNIKAVK